jgi:hypothetical protein
VRSSTVFRDHPDNSEKSDPRPCPGADGLPHTTDGPSLRTVAGDFPDVVINADRRYLRALTLPRRGFGEAGMGWRRLASLEAWRTEDALKQGRFIRQRGDLQ